MPYMHPADEQIAALGADTVRARTANILNRCSSTRPSSLKDGYTKLVSEIRRAYPDIFADYSDDDILSYSTFCELVDERAHHLTQQQ